MIDDTIAAIATPLGEGGLAVVRVSGTQSLEVADKIFQPIGEKSVKPSGARTHTIHFGKLSATEK
jgi:tRNA modification GTPase